MIYYRLSTFLLQWTIISHDITDCLLCTIDKFNFKMHVDTRIQGKLFIIDIYYWKGDRFEIGPIGGSTKNFNDKKGCLYTKFREEKRAL